MPVHCDDRKDSRQRRQDRQRNIGEVRRPHRRSLKETVETADVVVAVAAVAVAATFPKHKEQPHQNVPLLMSQHNPLLRRLLLQLLLRLTHNLR